MKIIAFLDAGTLRPGIVSNRLQLGDKQRFDWKLFLAWLNGLPGGLFDTHYYDAIPDMPSSGLTNFHTFLQQELKLQLHFTPLRQKRKTCPHCSAEYHVDEQKGVDVSLAISMYKLAPFYDQAILVSGDGDFAEVVKGLRDECGRRVVIIGWENGIAPQLRAAANQVMHLEDYQQHFINTQSDSDK
jgi:uncharacterized LabA/DUF88 family protein